MPRVPWARLSESRTYAYAETRPVASDLATGPVPSAPMSGRWSLRQGDVHGVVAAVIGPVVHRDGVPGVMRDEYPGHGGRAVDCGVVDAGDDVAGRDPGGRGGTVADHALHQRAVAVVVHHTHAEESG